MDLLKLGVILWSFVGIRYVELRQWPWHAVIYHGEDYKGGGTLLDPDYVLTSAQCVIGENEKLKNVTFISVHLGRIALDETPADVVQIINVSKIFTYPGFRSNRRDIALLKLSKPARYSEFVIPICIKNIRRRLKDQQEEINRPNDLEATTYVGWVVGFGATKSILESEECFSKSRATDSFTRLKLSAYTIMNYKSCTTYDRKLFEQYKPATAFCGIGSAKCNQYSKFLRKRKNGICHSSRSTHTVVIIDRNQKHISSGSIIRENFILTKCPTLIDILTTEVDWDNLWIKQPHVRVIREIYHPDYDPETERHNVWLLELESSLEFSSQLFPACLPNFDENHSNDPLHFNGYTAANNAFCEGIENQIVSNKQCDSRVGQAHRKHTIQKEEMYTSYKSIDNFSWSGIEGGPLQMINDINCKLLLIGIIKDVIPHKDNLYTIVHSQLRFYGDWIEQNVFLQLY